MISISTLYYNRKLNPYNKNNWGLKKKKKIIIILSLIKCLLKEKILRRKQRDCFLQVLKELSHLIQANVLVPAMFIAQEPHIPVEWNKKVN